MTLMIGSEQDMVELQVLPGVRAAFLPQDVEQQVLGIWRGPATALLLPTTPQTLKNVLSSPKRKDADIQSVIRVEGDVKLPLTGCRHTMEISSRLVSLEPGALSDLREVPGLGLRGLVGVVSGEVEELVIFCDLTLKGSQRFLLIECTLGSEMSLGDPMPCSRLIPWGAGDGAGDHSRTSVAARMNSCGAASGFVLPLNHASSGHEIRLRLLQGSYGSDFPLRCLGQGTLALATADSDVTGVTRLEIKDGREHVGFCMLSLIIKASFLKSPLYADFV